MNDVKHLLRAHLTVMELLKQRFPNMTTLEAEAFANDIVTKVHGDLTYGMGGTFTDVSDEEIP